MSSSKAFTICAEVDMGDDCGLLVAAEDMEDDASMHPATAQLPTPTIFAAWDERLQGKPCRSCNKLDREAEMVVCDRCEGCWHPECGADGGRNPIHDGPWYCATCRGYIATHGYQDITQDLGLIEYLWRGNLPDQDEEASRVLRLA